MEATQRALRNVLETVKVVQINEVLQYKQLLPLPVALNSISQRLYKLYR